MNARVPLPADGRARVVIEGLTPLLDGGRFPIKRTVGDTLTVEADCFADGHDQLVCLLRYKHATQSEWSEAPLQSCGNDRWRAQFVVDRVGRWQYGITAWADRFLTWRHEIARRTSEADIRAAALTGAELIDAAARRAQRADREHLTAAAKALRAATDSTAIRQLAQDEALAALASRYPDRTLAADSEVVAEVVVDIEKARFSSWYELFPRSMAPSATVHGSFADVRARLDYVAAMGFDVLYLPPIHPIGRDKRKGKNNALVAADDDVGSPWAIGAAEGGHKAVHPQLGTLDDLRALARAANERGIDLALDIALQCAPDHPYVGEHARWFRHRPDGSVQYAENPPKKYEDIIPFDFESEDWRALWQELHSVLQFWIDAGVRIFRIDNPHTKPFAFWEWAIADIKRQHPEVIFLAEAFTRPKVMHRLAKLGFTQSYTYFAWRNTRQEIIDYFNALAHGSGREYFRPNCWPNTPDILTEYLQHGGRAGFMTRLVLAATLSASYGIYGPAFELMENVPREPGSEEYLDSEKYQLRAWQFDRADSLADFIGRVNAIRRANAALQFDQGLRFHDTDNEALICYSKTSPDLDNTVLTVVNLDPHHVQSGWAALDLDALGLHAAEPYQVHELLSGARYLWSGPRNYVRIDPAMAPAHIFRLRRRLRTERDFDYFM